MAVAVVAAPHAAPLCASAVAVCVQIVMRTVCAAAGRVSFPPCRQQLRRRRKCHHRPADRQVLRAVRVPLQGDPSRCSGWLTKRRQQAVGYSRQPVSALFQYFLSDKATCLNQVRKCRPTREGQQEDELPMHCRTRPLALSSHQLGGTDLLLPTSPSLLTAPPAVAVALP